MYSELLTQLSNDIIKLIHNPEGYDIKIKVGEPPNTKEFKAHSLILRARSPYFNRALSHEWTKKQENLIIFEKPNVSPNIFEIILRYIYGEIFHLEDHDPFDILDLLIAADEIMIDDVLIDHVQTYLIHSKAAWIDENLLDILTIVSPRNSCRKLREYCLDEIILRDLSSFFDADWFPSLNEFILPESLLNNIMHYYQTDCLYSIMLPASRNPVIRINSSVIINPKCGKNIISWIEKKPFQSNRNINYTYNFNLLYRASCDDNGHSFHQKCDNVGPTLIVIKVEGTNEIIGGYNALNDGWQRGWLSFSRGSKDCFIFSLSNDIKKAEDAKYGYILSDQIDSAIYDHPEGGPCFGSGPDLYVSLKRDQPVGYRLNRCYKSGVFNRQGSFRWKDWEVFQIVKNINS
ncbi:15615_t:CDS:2 [Dentiscutata heterogama]|uniref:15615_t:CDS:1 n=1 Tax=Dentiscutata heterogama TaxID=1316150 RepID=A0ACA9K3Y2_9GLOM|nr:15615_t:CDS:2 [Dentiscutata heterogama]